MDGSLAKRIAAIRDRLGELLALVEADIDFAEEPIEFITPEDLQARLLDVLFELNELLGQSPPTEHFSQLPRILLLGPPNAGKSSLVNRLSGTPRSICAAVAGTTRDILAAPIQLGRGEAILLDSAGVDESEDHIIAQARELALSEAERVDLVCLVFDVAGLISDALPQSLARFIEQVRALDLPSTVVAANKVDLIAAGSRPAVFARLESLRLGEVVGVSAWTGEGIERLRECFLERTGGSETTAHSEAILMTARQRSAMVDAANSLQHGAELAAGASETIDCADLLAFELREALDHLGAVTGAVTTEDLLSHVFANFCIGK